MIIYKSGNIFTSECRYLVNPVNTVGVMGAGLAKAFRENFPSMFNKYKTECNKGTFKIGDLLIYDVSNGKGNLFVLNFPTKEHFRNNSKIEYVEKGLETFVRDYKELGIDSIAFPKLASGLGGLNWEKDVKPLMETYLGNLPDITIEIYE